MWYHFGDAFMYLKFNFYKKILYDFFEYILSRHFGTILFKVATKRIMMKYGPLIKMSEEFGDRMGENGEGRKPLLECGNC